MANSNLSKKQFDRATDTEDQQSRRSDRRRGLGYGGSAFNPAGYPFMIGTSFFGSGQASDEGESNETAQQEASEQAQGDNDQAGADGDNDAGQTASTDSGMGDGGTSAGMVGTS